MSLAPEWYTIRELAQVWEVQPKTVRQWLWQARKGGRGPTNKQVRRVRDNAARRHVEIRGDYAVVLFEWVHRKSFGGVKS